jgi:protein-tyrosine-phosphatase
MDANTEKLRVLFLCTGNSARSIMAEAIANQLFGERLAASSAGAQPRGEVHPLAFKTLMSHGLTIEGLRSEPIEPYVGRAFDLVITLCDTAAAEPCPSFPGAPATAHWPLPDPPAATQPEIAFVEVYRALWDAIEQLSSGHGTGDAAERAAAIGEDVAERFAAS